MAASRRTDLLALLFFAGCTLVLAWPILGWWLWEWTRHDSPSAYGLVVPALAGAMLWHRRAALAAAPKRVFFPALVLIVLALALLVVAVRRELLAAGSLALLLTLITSLWFLLGSAVLRALAAPLAFLCAMAPLPGPLLSDATLWAQNVSTLGAARMLALLGLNPVQEGNSLRLDGYTLDIAAPCSGFKLLVTLLVLGTALAWLTDLPRAKRWALALATLPLSLLVNSLRIALIGLVGEAGGFTLAERLHDASGYLCLILCLAGLFATAKGMGCKSLCGQPLF